VFIITSRSASSVKKGNRIPMPRSKPSMTTYMNMPNRMITAQIRVRSPPMDHLPPVDVAPPGARNATGTTSRILAALFRRRKRPGRRTPLARPARGRAVFRPGRTPPDQAQYVERARSEQQEIHNNEQDQRQAHFEGTMRTHRVGRTHHPVHHPGLPTHFGGEPAGKYGHEARRPHP